MVKSSSHIPVQFGRYRVLHALAAGGMGSVYVAKDPVLTRLVAIKVLHAALQSRKRLLKRFFQEAQIVAQLRSPNIVEVYDFGQEGDCPFLVMEYVDGLSLGGVLEHLFPEPMDPVVAAALICQAAEGLTAAAHRGVVHRDIKPENLLISPQGYLKIADFGISHVKDQSATRTGAVIGSPAYMSPEQAEGEKGINYQSDMFSLGTVFYLCLSGQEPFKAESVAGTIKKIVSEPPRALQALRPSMDPDLIYLVETLLNKDPLKRGAGPSWLKEKLKEYLLKKRVADPVERIKEYLAELSGRDIQTTGFINPVLIASAMASREAQQRPLRIQRKRFLWTKWAGGAFAVLLSLFGGGLALFHGYSEGPRKQPPGHSISAVQSPGIEQGTSLLAAPSSKLGVDSSKEPKIEPSQGGSTGLNQAPRTDGKRPLPTSKGLGGGTAEKHGRHASISIVSAPPFAEVFMDGNPVGTTPLDAWSVAPGRHRIRLEVSQVNAVLDTVLDIPKGAHKFKFRIPVDVENLKND